MRQIFNQVTICNSEPLKVKVWPSTRSLDSQQTASYKGPKNDLCKTIQNRKTNILIDIKKPRITYEPHQQTTTTEQQVPDLGLVQTNAAVLNVF